MADNNTVCETCGGDFYDKYSLQRHQRDVDCKQKVDERTCTICNERYKSKQYLQDHFETKKHINNVAKQNSKNVNSKNSKVRGNGNTSISGNNNITDSNIVVNIVAHTKENLDELTDKEKIEILKNGNCAVPALIKKINFNPRLPQNHNVYLSGVTSKHGHVYDGAKWILKKTEVLIPDLICKHGSNIENLSKDYSMQLPKHLIIRLREMLDTLDYEPSGNTYPDKDKIKLKKDITEDIRLLLVNEQDIPINTSKLSK